MTMSRDRFFKYLTHPGLVEQLSQRREAVSNRNELSDAVAIMKITGVDGFAVGAVERKIDEISALIKNTVKLWKMFSIYHGIGGTLLKNTAKWESLFFIKWKCSKYK